MLTDDLEKSRIPLGMFQHIQSLHSSTPVTQSDSCAPPEPAPASSGAPPPQRLRGSPSISSTMLDGTRITATGKQPKDRGIADRVARLHGLTVPQALNMDIPKNDGTTRKYNTSDLRYDMKCRYIENVAFSASVSDPSANYEALQDMLHEYHTACLTTSGGEPQTNPQARRSSKWAIPGGWRDCELDEMQSLEDMKVVKWYPLSAVPPGTKLVDTKMVYKEKQPMPGVPGRRRARCVARGFQETVNEIGDSFSPVCRHESVRAFYAAAVYHGYALRSVDVCQAFLTADMQREVWIRPPVGHEREGMACKLLKGLYGLADSPRLYNRSFDAYLRSLKLQPQHADTCLYMSKNSKYPSVMVLEYVDDLQIAGLPEDIDHFVKDLQLKYKLRDYGEPKSFIGMEVTRSGRSITLTQTKYIEQMAERFGLTDANYVSTPMEPNTNLTAKDASHERPDPKLFRAKVGSIMYAQNLTQPGVSFVLTQLSRHLAAPTQAHMKAANRCIAYLYHHRHLGITFDGSADNTLVGWADANYAACPDTRRSTGFRLFTCLGGPISWATKMQRTVATSTAEAEYMCVSDAAHEALWLRKLLSVLLHIDLDRMPPTEIMEDNRAAQKWCYNPLNHAKQKHIDVAYHFVREQCTEFNALKVAPIDTDSMLADIGTKALPEPRFQRLIRKIMNISDRSLRSPTQLQNSVPIENKAVLAGTSA